MTHYNEIGTVTVYDDAGSYEETLSVNGDGQFQFEYSDTEITHPVSHQKAAEWIALNTDFELSEYV